VAADGTGHPPFGAPQRLIAQILDYHPDAGGCTGECDPAAHGACAHEEDFRDLRAGVWHYLSQRLDVGTEIRMHV
jgi:hypothetical protein